MAPWNLFIHEELKKIGQKTRIKKGSSRLHLNGVSFRTYRFHFNSLYLIAVTRYSLIRVERMPTRRWWISSKCRFKLIFYEVGCSILLNLSHTFKLRISVFTKFWNLFCLRCLRMSINIGLIPPLCFLHQNTVIRQRVQCGMRKPSSKIFTWPKIQNRTAFFTSTATFSVLTVDLSPLNEKVYYFPSVDLCTSFSSMVLRSRFLTWWAIVLIIGNNVSHFTHLSLSNVAQSISDEWDSLAFEQLESDGRRSTLRLCGSSAILFV